MLKEGGYIGNIIFCIIYTFIEESLDEPLVSYTKIARECMRKIIAAPKFVLYPMILLTVIYNLICVFYQKKTFLRLDLKTRKKYIQKWRLGKFNFQRDFIFFYQSVFLLVFYSFVDYSKR